MVFKIILTLFVVTIISCREKIDIELNKDFQRLVVEGGLSTDTTSHEIILSLSVDPLGKDSTRYVSGALVTIRVNQQIFLLSESRHKPGHYYTQPDVFGIPGNEYTLTIENVDINSDQIPETYTAKSTMPNFFKLDSIKVVRYAFAPTRKGFFVSMFGQDPGGRNYFMFNIFKNKFLVTDSIHEVSTGKNTGNEGAYMHNIVVDFVLENTPEATLNKGDTITLEVCMITEEKYQFINALKNEFRPKNPIFSEPWANVPTNFSPSNRIVGFFSCYAISRKSIIYMD